MKETFYFWQNDAYLDGHYSQRSHSNQISFPLKIEMRIIEIIRKATKISMKISVKMPFGLEKKKTFFICKKTEIQVNC